MARWEIFERDRVRESEPKPAPGEKKPAPEAGDVAVGRGPSDESSSNAPERSERRQQDPRNSTPDRRTRHQDRDRMYSLRNSELEAMADIGRFRTVDVRDLARIVYHGDSAQTQREMDNLSKQGLIEQRMVFRAHKAPRKLVTLTEQGQRVVRKASGLPKEQRLYHGFVKPRELDHDADLYKVYQKAAQEIRERGGRPTRVRLDFELKEVVNRAKEAARRLPEHERAKLLSEVAREQELTIDGTKIQLPDVQVEYETREGKIERENLELLSQNYREAGLRSKAGAGFKIYARAGETNRIRRALHDTGMVREVLSV